MSVSSCKIIDFISILYSRTEIALTEEMPVTPGYSIEDVF